jgi:hypothetical protein
MKGHSPALGCLIGVALGPLLWIVLWRLAA